MEKYLPVLKRTRLFSGVEAEELPAMLNCLGAVVRSYRKGEYVFRSGEQIGSITVLVEGRLLIQKDDYWGNRSIVNVIEPGELFGEAYAAPNSGALRNDVLAAEDSAVVSFDLGRLLTGCSSVCPFHARTVRNLFFAVCEKNRALVSKMAVFSERSTREKLLAYLSEEARRQGSSEFTLPFDRQQLADYLAVDRSAMSRELGRLRDEGLVSYHRSRFVLHGERDLRE